MTPDSFSDGGRYNTLKTGLQRVEDMLEHGATIIDIGGYSSRPYAEHISEKDEFMRIEHMIKEVLRLFPKAIVSIDTFRSGVAHRALDLGAHIINDIFGGRYDDKMLEIVGKYSVPYVMMHIQGTPQNMQDAPTYSDIVQEVLLYFTQQIERARFYGIKDLIIDPGFGFGKSLPHNYKLFKHLEDFHVLECPLMVGISRKSMLYKLFDTNPMDVLEVATALHYQALMMGVNILRVHDVQACARAMHMYKYIKYL